MSLRRLVVIALSVVGAVLLAIVLYLALADLGRHKGRIEAFVTKQIGRPFAIDGALQLKVFPSIHVLAERVRVGNAEWGSKPQMVEIGRLSTHIGLWSLISGPVDIRSFELSDVSVLLEKEPRTARATGCSAANQKRRLRPTRAPPRSRRSSSTANSATCRSFIASPGSRTASRSLRR